MLDYQISEKGVPLGRVSDLDTRTIRDAIAYMERGEPVGGLDTDNTTYEAVLDRLRLELDIRAWGFAC